MANHRMRGGIEEDHFGAARRASRKWPIVGREDNRAGRAPHAPLSGVVRLRVAVLSMNPLPNQNVT
jgi:hypothetical protein